MEGKIILTRKFRLFLGLVGFLLLLLLLLQQVRLKPVEKNGFLFGTLIRITAYGPKAAIAVEQAFAEMERIHRLTAQNQGIVARLNAEAGRKPVPVDGETFFLLQRVFRLAEATAGHFNPIIGALVELWDFDYGGKGRLPSPEEIRRVLPLTDSNLVAFDQKAQTVFLKQAGMKLDLSGVAKGYAVDRAWEILQQFEVTGALINGGESSIRVLGERPGGGPWRIALSHPRREEWIGVLYLESGQALGTSADTERYIESEGQRYSHLLNPFTGYPPTDIMAVTVVTDSALEADLYSTAVFVADGDNRERLINRLGLEAVIVDDTARVVMTPGMKAIMNGEEGEEFP
jgi:thiamine biosynthesis lipoprotein